ncbi:MAG: Tetratricopeptide repeat protein [Myxococcaceae bacterium]|nr:Tetratricopeptide repeat protein [Myxococcaceae bacterium]
MISSRRMGRATAGQGSHALTQRLLVFFVPALVTLPRFWNGLVFDDVFVIERSDFIHRLGNLPRVFSAHAMVASSLDQAVGKPAMDTYRPISIGSFFWDAWLSGRAPWAYHITNTLLHGVVCLLVLRTLQTLLRSESDRAWAVQTVAPNAPTTWPLAAARAASTLPLYLTLCFGLAPWLAEAQVWINGRSDLWLSLFVLSALLLQRRALMTQQLGPALTAGACMLCAFWSKETAVCALPFVMLVPLERPVDRATRLRLAIPVGLAFLAYTSMRALALHGLRAHEDARQLGAALWNLPLLLVDGAYHVLIPSPFALRNLRDDYAGTSGWVTAAAALFCGLVMSAALVQRRRRPLIAWSLGFAATTLAPSMMVTTALWPGFGRYLYLPAIGLYAALGAVLAALEARRPELARIRSLVLITLASASAACLVDATLALRDEEIMYARSVARAPTQAWAIGFLGLAKKREGRCDEAVALLGTAAQRDPSEPRYAVQLARCLITLGALEQAREVARRGRIRFANTRAESGFLLAEALTLHGEQLSEAKPLLERCLQLDPQRTDCSASLAELQRRSAYGLRNPRAQP